MASCGYSRPNATTVVPVAASVELARLSDLRPSAVRVVGASHVMDDPEALAALRAAIEEAFHRRQVHLAWAKKPARSAAWLPNPNHEGAASRR
jgi:hypothetical protein